MAPLRASQMPSSKRAGPPSLLHPKLLLLHRISYEHGPGEEDSDEASMTKEYEAKAASIAHENREHGQPNQPGAREVPHISPPAQSQQDGNPNYLTPQAQDMGGALKQIDQSSMHSLHSLSFSKHSNESPDKPIKSLHEQGEPLDQNMDDLRDLLHSKVDQYLDGYLVEDLNEEEEKERSVRANVRARLVSGTPS